MGFRARAPEKSESVYYNIQFWLFLGHFWTSLDMVIFSPKTFLGKPMSLITLRGCLAHLCCLEKAFEHPICSFLVKPKI